MNRYSDLFIHYINSDKFPDRKLAMESKLTDLGLPYERIGIEIQEGAILNIVSNAHILATKIAIENNRFPLLILEDDAELKFDFPHELKINSDAKLIYLGLSLHDAGQGRLELKPYDKYYYRVKNSLSAHAILIPSRESADYYIDLCSRSIEISNYHDKELAYDSHKELFLTPKKGPVFFQNDGHTKPVTDFDTNRFTVE